MSTWEPSEVSPPPLVHLTVGQRTHLAVQFSDWTLCGVWIDEGPDGPALMCRQCAGRLPEEADSMTHSPEPKVGSSTPWGRADFVDVLAPGIVNVSTPGHGGVWVAPHLNAEIHPVWRSDSGWYEEDCEAVIVFATFPEVFPQASQERMHDSLAWSFSRQHAVAFPGEAKAREGRPTFETAMADLDARRKQQQA